MMPWGASFAERKVNVSKLPAFRAEHFPYAGPYPWLDRPDAPHEIDAREAAGSLTAEQAAQCRFWEEHGYIILPGLIASSVLDSIWEAYEKAIHAGRIVLPPESAGENDPWPGRYLNPHKKVGALCQILKHPELLAWLHLITEREPKPLQTIFSHKGSQQGVHSDSIHMTTYPLGYLTAAWVAFEDIDPRSGPLVYYPGSHRWPYVFSKDVGIGENEMREAGYTGYRDKYEPYIRRAIEEREARPSYFQARKGDVLIWHANLLHGGSARADLSFSRKALVCHFFVKGAFVYHDLSAKRSMQQYLGTCLLRDENGAHRLTGRK